jgi:dipeptidase E
MDGKLVLLSEFTAGFEIVRRELPAAADGCRVLFIPTAARGEGWEPENEKHVLPFERLGFEVEMFDLEGADPATTKDKVSGADIVYVGGGNTFHLLKHMRASGFADLVRGFIERGGTYLGSSAGTVAVCPDIGFAATVDDRSKGDGDDRGLGLVDLPILPHVENRWVGDQVQAIAESMWAEGQGFYDLRDDEGIVVDANGIRRVDVVAVPSDIARDAP